MKLPDGAHAKHTVDLPVIADIYILYVKDCSESSMLEILLNSVRCNLNYTALQRISTFLTESVLNDSTAYVKSMTSPSLTIIDQDV